MAKSKESRITGKVFVIAGTLQQMTYADATDLIFRLGGKVRTQVSGTTDYLIYGARPGHKKVIQAQLRGVHICTESWLMDRLREALAEQ